MSAGICWRVVPLTSSKNQFRSKRFINRSVPSSVRRASAHGICEDIRAIGAVNHAVVVAPTVPSLGRDVAKPRVQGTLASGARHSAQRATTEKSSKGAVNSAPRETPSSVNGRSRSPKSAKRVVDDMRTPGVKDESQKGHGQISMWQSAPESAWQFAPTTCRPNYPQHQNLKAASRTTVGVVHPALNT